jgi:hypothetical protein
MRLVGLVHERFPMSMIMDINRDRPIPHIPVRLLHDGYVGEQDEKKVQRNIELLEQEVAENPNDFYVLGMLAKTLIRVSRTEEAREIVVRLANSAARDEPSANIVSVATLALSMALSMTPDDEIMGPEPLEWMRKIARSYGNSPMALWEYAHASVRRRDYQGAEAALIRLTHFRQFGGYERLAPINMSVFGPELDENLAEVRLWIEKTQSASD